MELDVITKTIDVDGARLLLDIGEHDVEVTVMLEGKYRGISVPKEDLVKAIVPTPGEAKEADYLNALRAASLENQALCAELAAVSQILGKKEGETAQQALIRRSKEQIDLGRQECLDLLERISSSTSNHAEATWAHAFARRLKER